MSECEKKPNVEVKFSALLAEIKRQLEEAEIRIKSEVASGAIMGNADFTSWSDKKKILKKLIDFAEQENIS